MPLPSTRGHRGQRLVVVGYLPPGSNCHDESRDRASGTNGSDKNLFARPRKPLEQLPSFVNDSSSGNGGKNTQRPALGTIFLDRLDQPPV